MHMNYSKSYAADLLRGVDVTQRPPLTQNLARELAGKNKKLLDVGCGTGKKSFSLADDYQTIIGLEPSGELLEIAQSEINNHKLKNCYVVDGVSEMLPFQNNAFDVVMCVLSWWHASEIHRVLNSAGVFLLECLGPKDKADFTRFFGKDDKGWRGANLNTDFAEMEKNIKNKLANYFQHVTLENITWQTRYSKAGLWALLNNTFSTVRDFHPVNDQAAFDEAIKQLQTDEGVVLTQNRLLVVAKRANEVIIY